MSGHTPGPWEARFTEEVAAIAQVGYMPHATVFNRAFGGALKAHLSEEDLANAHLIAAALDMLKELKWIAGRIDRCSGSPSFTSDEHDRINAVIAKAEGRA